MAAKKQSESESQSNEQRSESQGSTDSGRDHVDQLIRQHVGYALVAGAVPIPLVDIAAVTVIQIDMVRQLAKHHGVDFDQARGRSLIASLIGATGGHLLGRLGASLVKGIPGVGSLLGIGSQVVLAGASTYAVGKVFDDHFSRGGTLANFEAGSWRGAFDRFFAGGRSVAERMRKKQGSDDVVGTLAKLKELKDSGAISEQEYEETKASLLQKLRS